MKIKWLEKIITQIQKNMHCPRCKCLINKDFIEITSIGGSDFVKFSSHCQKCGTTAKITAEVEKKLSKNLVKSKLAVIKNSAFKKKDSVTLLKRSLLQLNSRNIRKILNPSVSGEFNK